jgi:hypothetical protein
VTREDKKAGFADLELVTRARVSLCSADRGPAERAALANLLADHAGHLLALAHAALKVQEAYRQLPPGTDFYATTASLGGTALSVVQELDRIEDQARQMAARDLEGGDDDVTR